MNKDRIRIDCQYYFLNIKNISLKNHVSKIIQKLALIFNF